MKNLSLPRIKLIDFDVDNVNTEQDLLSLVKDVAKFRLHVCLELKRFEMAAKHGKAATMDYFALNPRGFFFTDEILRITQDQFISMIINYTSISAREVISKVIFNNAFELSTRLDKIDLNCPIVWENIRTELGVDWASSWLNENHIIFLRLLLNFVADFSDTLRLLKVNTPRALDILRETPRENPAVESAFFALNVCNN